MRREISASDGEIAAGGRKVSPKASREVDVSGHGD